MRLLALLIALAALPALGSDVPPPPPPPPPPSGDAPTTTADEPPPPPPSEALDTKGPRTNWAKTGAIIGFAAAGAVLLLNIVNDVYGASEHPLIAQGFKDAGDFGPDSAVELLPIAITAVAGPVTYAGGNSARWTKSISGSRGLRITGWIGYGVSLLLQLISLGYWPWLRTLSGVVGAGALVCHGVDALISSSEAADVASIASADDEPVHIKPTISLLPAFGGRAGGATFGLVGWF